MNEYHFGIKVGPHSLTHPDGTSSTYYAEVYPVKFHWRHPLARWNTEIHETVYNAAGEQEIGVHWQMKDFESFSLRTAVSKADKITDQIYWDQIYLDDPDLEARVEQLMAEWREVKPDTEL